LGSFDPGEISVTIGVPIFLLTFLATFVLVIRGLIQLGTKHPDRAVRTFKVLGVLVGIYAVALIGTSLTSHRSMLQLGEAKCFDDWCFSVDKVSRSPQGLTLAVAASNNGRHPERPDTPRAFLVVDGKPVAIDCPKLSEQVGGHGENPFTIQLPVPLGAKTLDFLVTEGGGPSPFIIGDENSPLHAKAVWPIKP
jgi:hypothetical protein